MFALLALTNKHLNVGLNYFIWVGGTQVAGKPKNESAAVPALKVNMSYLVPRQVLIGFHCYFFLPSVRLLMMWSGTNRCSKCATTKVFGDAVGSGKVRFVFQFRVAPVTVWVGSENKLCGIWHTSSSTVWMERLWFLIRMSHSCECSRLVRRWSLSGQIFVHLPV